MEKKLKKEQYTKMLRLTNGLFIIPTIEYNSKQNINNKDLNRLAFIEFDDSGITILPDQSSSKKLHSIKTVVGSMSLSEDKLLLQEYILQNFQSKESKVLVEYVKKEFVYNQSYKIGFNYSISPNDELYFKGYIEGDDVFFDKIKIPTNLKHDSYLKFLFCTSNYELAKERLKVFVFFNNIVKSEGRIQFYIYKKRYSEYTQAQQQKTTSTKVENVKKNYLDGKEVNILKLL